MYLHTVSRTFDHTDHRIFARTMDGNFVLPNPKQVRANRKIIQAYLYRIQQRVNRGYTKQATQLFNHLVTLFVLPYWVQVALTNEIKRPVKEVSHG